MSDLLPSGRRRYKVIPDPRGFGLIGVVDPEAYRQAIAAEDDALDRGDTQAYYVALCAAKRAAGRWPHPRDVARALGLPAPSAESIQQFEEDLVEGRLPDEVMSAAEIAERYCATGAWATPAQRERSRSDDGAARWPAPQTSSAPSEALNGKPSWALGGGVEPRPRQREHVELRRRAEEFDPWRRERETTQVVTISIASGPWRELCGFARQSEDGREVGGFLLARHLRSWERRVSIARATVASEARDEHKMSLNFRALEAEQAWIRSAEADGHYGECGTWHTHCDGNGRPSEGDVAQWLNGRDVLERPYVGLILTAAADDPGWSRPRPHGWLVRRTESGLAVCEPAEVAIGREG